MDLGSAARYEELVPVCQQQIACAARIAIKLRQVDRMIASVLADQPRRLRIRVLGPPPGLLDGL